MKRLSIIVPVYKVEAFIEKCLLSLLHQDIPENEYEIICVNDGSPDGSRDIIINLQKKHNNIILIDQENQGVSIARNNGMEKASGKYTLFIDSDDFVDANSFDRILKNAEHFNTQVSFLGFTVLKVDGSIESTVFNQALREKVYSGIYAYIKMRDEGLPDPDRIYAVLIETQFLKNNRLQFLPGVPYLEDGEFISRILTLVERCVFDGYSFYQRTTRPGSATQSDLFHSDRATNGFLSAAQNLKRFQNEQSLTEEQKLFLNQPILKFVLLGINSSTGFKLFGKLTKTIKSLKKAGFKKLDLEKCSSSYRLFGKLYNLSPYLGAIALTAYPRIYKLFKVFNK